VGPRVVSDVADSSFTELSWAVVVVLVVVVVVVVVIIVVVVVAVAVAAIIIKITEIKYEVSLVRTMGSGTKGKFVPVLN
jgi:hypothetical protein